MSKLYSGNSQTGELKVYSKYTGILLYSGYVACEARYEKESRAVIDAIRMAEDEVRRSFIIHCSSLIKNLL